MWDESSFLEELIPLLKAEIDSGRHICPHVHVLVSDGRDRVGRTSALMQHLSQCSQCAEIYMRLSAFNNVDSSEDSTVRRTHYEVLEVLHEATPEQIKESYRVLASVWHPGRFEPGTANYGRATERLKDLNTAYEVLKDRAKRAAYDLTLRPSGRGDDRSNSKSYSVEQERTIDTNRKRFRQALTSPEMRAFCAQSQLEQLRQDALTRLESYDVAPATELLTRFNTARRGR